MVSGSRHWMPLYWSDYLGKTSHLNTEEHGAYLLLIGAYWQRGKALPDDDRYLSTAARLSRKRWLIMRQKISEFFAVSEGSWTHDRVEIELLKSCERTAKASASAYARWDAKPMLPTPTKEQVSKIEGISGFIVGKKRGGNGSVTILDPNERVNRFKKALAESFKEKGWEIVLAASDPQNPSHAIALETCKTQAKLIGKGWPHRWLNGA